MVEIYFYPGKIKVKDQNFDSELCTTFEIFAWQKHDCFVYVNLEICKIFKKQKYTVHLMNSTPSFKTFCITNCMNRNLYLEKKNGRTGNY